MSANGQSKGVIGSMAASASDRRRSSGTSAQKFAGLHSQKRTSQDATAAARKQSFAEQAPKPGFFGGLWNNFTKGGGK
ncbi:MAG: hypothetical protein OHK93_002375 [Ramalina farinacea]|uniref:Uncharacterized protein n=1 Tax=Ramalina farinacea TaxID=258253 RepID=A0AA43QUK4_9LECA|nr:hypothetical protein [Ramalina farinacea]